MRTTKGRRSGVEALSAVSSAALAARPAGASPEDTGARLDPNPDAQAQPAVPAPDPDAGSVYVTLDVRF
jgi:hypothetical protein